MALNEIDTGGAEGASGQGCSTAILDAAIAGKISFATHQNAVPVLRDLVVSNTGLTALENVRIDVESIPSVIFSKSWRLDRVAPGATVRPSGRDVALNAALLLSVNEAVRVDVTFSLRDAFGVLLAEHKCVVDVLARNEWGGVGAMPELLASFVQPNDPAVADILRSASEILRRAGKRDTVEGYQSKARSRVYEIASAIWSAIVGLKLTYAEPPASFEQNGQKVRTPSQVVEKHLATCLDTSVLFAAVFEQAGLHPVLVLLKDHAFVGVWLQPEEFSSILVEDASSLRKRVALNELILFETTMATIRSHVGFSNAIAEGARRIAEENEGNFVMALDVQRARMQKLRPLALELVDSAVGMPGGNETPSDPDGEPLEAAPVLPGFDVAGGETAPTTAEGRLERWQRKLLDLSVRNRLLNLKPGASAIRLYCTDPAGLEDRIASEEKFKIVNAPPLEGSAGRDASLHLARTGRSLDEDYASAALERGELLSPLPADVLDGQLTELFRKARLDFAEGGANTLFLALGFLSWRKSDGAGQNYRAPLILLPVKLERGSARSAMRLSHHEDETRFNLTLLQMLRQDFELEIPELVGPQLPGDEAGVDVPGIWNLVRRAVRDMPGFEVTEEVMLGTFSFAKYLMWKDLVDRTEALKSNPVVRHLLETPRDAYINGAELPSTDVLDREIEPGNLFTPLPADSSQLAAVVGSARGCDFVLDGPPGTGKSQTIANIIAHNLALGRKVLFVAEKRAALDVVYRRLKAKGLGQFCLELHSNKAAKLDVLKQLDGAWTASGNSPASEWEKKANELKSHRDALNKYVAALHHQHANGMTPHYAIGLVARDGHQQAFRLNWPPTVSHDRAAMDGLREAAHRLSLTWLHETDGALRHVRRSEWSNLWQNEIAAAAAALEIATRELSGAWGTACGHIGVTPKIDRNTLSTVAQLCSGLVASKGEDFSFAFTPDAGAVMQHAVEGLREIEAYQREGAGLSAEYSPEVVRALDANSYMQKWQVASGAFWPLSILKKSAVEKAIRPTSSDKVDPAKDLPILAGLRRRLERLDTLSNDVFRVPQWAGIATDVDKLKKVLADSVHLRELSTRLAPSTEQVVKIKETLASLCSESNALLDVDAPAGAAFSGYGKVYGAFLSALKKFEDLAGDALSLAEEEPFDALARDCEALIKHATQLNAWCAWRRSRLAACDAGLQPLVEALEDGSVEAMSVDRVFELAYARWFAETQIDADPVLRAFNRNEHEDVIARFRRVDDEFAALTTDYIRAKILQQIPPKESRNQPPGFGALAHQLTLQRRHKPVRQLVAEMGPALTTLAPCLLMSPLSVAQFLPPDAALFDLVIFDEASQITPWDAVGAIARGKQVIVAGDPKQMPPTSFFDRSASQSDDDSEVEQDMESILDECLGARLPSRRLTWHYRSKHESLIAFSNHSYYDGDLITFPAPVTRESAVSLVTVPGVWSRGKKSRTNQIEAEALVTEVVRRLQDPSFLDEKGEPLSLGIITLNGDQQRLVEDLLDVARKRYPALEPFFADSVAEPVIVKNLETVQGDERDIILLGIGFGPETVGAPTMPMNFGPLNRSGGWRRLNVAITRARREMMIFTSFPEHFIDLRRTSADAVRNLKHFLQFAQRGPRALGEAVSGSMGGFESPFEQAVARGLRERGWTTVPQIGVSRFRIDLGVVHPDRPGDFLVGVECDGATYHSAATARDRDKVRAAVLHELGWKLVRVWSTDWWVNSRSALDRLDIALKQILEKSRTAIIAKEAERQAQAANKRAASSAFSEPSDTLGEAGFKDTPLPVFESQPEPATVKIASAPQLVPVDDRLEMSLVGRHDGLYCFASFDDLGDVISPDRFQEPDYMAVLRTMVRRIIGQEAPIRDTILVERIARAHGFQRSGRLIRDRVLSIARQEAVLRPEEGGAVFVWSEDVIPEQWANARAPAREEDVRALEDIASEELAAGMLQCRNSEVEAARLFGIKRLSTSGRERLIRAVKVRS